MPSPARSRTPRRLELGVGARLEFLERLHSCTIETHCAEQVLVWLAEAGIIRRGLCATLDAEQTEFEVLASHDFAEGDAASILSNRSFREELLRLAFEGDRVMPVPSAPRARGGARWPMQATPLGRPGEGRAASAS